MEFCVCSIPIPQALKLFVSGVHHVAVFDRASAGHFMGAFTSLGLLRVLRDSMPILGPLASQSVGHLFPTGPDTVVSAGVDTPTRACFQTLLERHFLGLPVLSGDGSIAANLSVSDIRALATMSREDANAAMDGPVISFIRSRGLLRPPVTVLATDSLAVTIELMVTAHVHRVYVVDAGGRPIGVVTVTDILRVLAGPAVLAHIPASPLSLSPVPAPPMVLSSLAAVSAHAFMKDYGVPVSNIVDVSIKAPLSEVLGVMAARRVSAVAVYMDVSVDMAGVYRGGGGMSGSEFPESEKVYVGWIDAAGVCWFERGMWAVPAVCVLYPCGCMLI